MITNVSSLRRFIRKFVNEVNEVGLKGYCDRQNLIYSLHKNVWLDKISKS